MFKQSGIFILGLAMMFALSCTQQGPVDPGSISGDQDISLGKKKKAATGAQERALQLITNVNSNVQNLGMPAQLSKIEWITYSASEHVGQTVFANDRTKQLGAHWVPNDERRLAAGTAITYLVDQSDGAANPGLSNDDTEPAIDRGMMTWDNVQCANIPLVKVDDTGDDPDLVDGLLGFGGVTLNPFIADIVHAGWLPKDFFDALAEGGGDFILGVTFTFVFVDDDGNLTDINNDGKLDVALKEIYYNNNFDWGIDTEGYPIDVESIALHESGHALSQGHFGKIFVTNANNKAHFAPYAVMNALYAFPGQELQGTDIGGHCSIWASWPNK